VSRVFDVIVVGVGGMGSAACYQLAKRGQRVLGLEKFEIGHAMGSSHGLTRILRLAYFEGEAYVPLVQRSRQLWIETGDVIGRQLFFEVGALDMAPGGDDIVAHAEQACLAHDLPHEILQRDAIERRFPALALPQGHIGLYQPQSGFVASELALRSHVELARQHGASIREREPMLEWTPTAGGGVRVRTAQGTYEAGRLVLSPGAWIGSIVPGLARSTTVIRQTLAWFDPRQPQLLAPERFPVFTLKVEEGHVYGFPLWGHPGFKLGSPHYSKDVFDPDTPTREPAPGHEAILTASVRRYVPAAAGPLLNLKACLYTMTPDEHFVVDTLPGHEQVIVASPCSGHGYKFASVMGEILADLAVTGRSRFNLSMFSLRRFAEFA
jgi:sarcosine oxidase